MTRELGVDAIYGAFSLLRGFYIAVVTRSVLVAHAPNGSPIRQVLEMEWVLVGQGIGPALSAAEAVEEGLYLSLLRSMGRSGHFYFSHGYDLSQSVQRNGAQGGGSSSSSSSEDSQPLAPPSTSSAAASAPPPSSPLPHQPLQPHPACWSQPPAETPYLWNRGALRELLDAPGAGALFASPFINGYVGSCSGGDLGVPPAPRRTPQPPSPIATFLLISRRAVARSGTRYGVRGVDAEGAVANYCETEQVLLWGDGGVSAYVQLRGSIPLLWEQVPSLKYTPRVALAPVAAGTPALAAFRRHAQGAVRRYGRVTAINLIDQKGDPKKPGEAFE